ncbi:hypothetical protein DID78_06075 [Candidatus Marinamargulisbacteria bacterium SCGC AG-343-D04]|nr:hypothetical protein DID78_06075 [Candidatus Marinamargulisbacteria bacterium SCGC AG-343-D04]
MDFPVSIVKEKRKSLSIQFTQSGVFLIKAPYFLKQSFINDFLDEKKSWMSKTLDNFSAFSYLKTPNECVTDVELAYFGEKYSLSVFEKKSKEMPYFKDNRLCFFVDRLDEKESNIKKLILWYRHLAKEIFEDRVYFFANLLGVEVKTVRIKELKSRWGSCSTLGNINLNWKLIKAPFSVIDYVIAHECCHLLHMNHSYEFWDCVESVYPDYKKCKSWLNKYGHYMLF